MRSFASIGVKTTRGTARDYNVRPRLENGQLILPSARVKLGEMRQVIFNKRDNTILINMVDGPLPDPEEVAKSIQEALSGFDTGDYL